MYSNVDEVAEWLRRWTAANLSGVGSNPILIVIFSENLFTGHQTSDIAIDVRTSETQVILYSVQCCYAVHWTDSNGSIIYMYMQPF